MEREMGLEPTNGYGAHYVWPQTGMKTGLMPGYCREPQTMEVDDVWQYEAVHEYFAGRVGTDE
jgi:hypothetical protein